MTESTDMSSREPDDARKLRDRDDEPSFFTLPLMFPHSDMTPAKDYCKEYAGKNNRRGQWLVVLVGINPPQTFFVQSLIIQRNMFLWFSF